MQATYGIELTAHAEKIYGKLCKEAESCVNAGDNSNRKVSLLISVDKALDEIISIKPFDPRLTLALAGCLAQVYILKQDSVRIYYAANLITCAIRIFHIGTHMRRTDPSWLQEIIRSGQLDDVLLHLGIHNKDAFKDAHPLLLN